ncbi:hypothetical protein SADUNF_Sadunf05G0106000 [Salix dunnii]|uniref:Protein kinase domain-containing protein n=1 Tax=Salix dunnii TaxID=1413687 RepID=A0A835KCF6_9ROSI|nr:hypothetical protein SADUNF_Sadunf05G0106000 [Salix dunnii]
MMRTQSNGGTGYQLDEMSPNHHKAKQVSYGTKAKRATALQRPPYNLSWSTCFPNLPVKYFMNCGSDSNVDLGDLRNFVGDKNSNPSFSVGKSYPVRNENPSPGISPLYHTARIYTKISRYMLNITQTGSYLVRLHFFPFSFKTTHLADALFSVSASNFSLLSNFSVGNSSTEFPVIKEFFLTIAEGNFDIYFIPADETRFAFESLITPIPPLLSIDGALRTLYRIDVGGDQKVNDTLWRTWVPDNDYLTFPSAVTASSYDGELQESRQRLVVNEIAPDAVYKTYKKVSIDNNGSSNFPNITWRFNVSKEARHLVRLHVCDLLSESPGTVKFDLNISSNFSEVIDPNANGFSEMRIPLFYDYAVSSDDSGYMSFSIAPNKTSIMKVAFLNGLEIMEFVGNSTFEMPVEHETRKLETRKHLALMIASAGGVALILVLILLLSICLRLGRLKPVKALILENEFLYGRGRSPSSTNERTENASIVTNLNLKLKMSLAEILAATENFSPKLLIGEGGFGKGCLKNPSAATEFTWKQRLEICNGAAKGLHYLHTGPDGGILHRDVKSTNILLDEHYVAKVADFGLSQSGMPDPDHISTDLKGSFGYLDPEYFRTLQLTNKSDVYSFGVILLEMLCARPPIVDSKQREEINLAEWGMFWQKEGQLEKIIDPLLVGHINRNSLRKFGEITEKCLKPQGADRPNMLDVCWDLEYALQLQQTPAHREAHEDSTTTAASTDLALPPMQNLSYNMFPVDDYSDTTASARKSGRGTFSMEMIQSHKTRHPLPSILFLLHLLSLHLPSLAYTVPDKYFISCGSDTNSTASGRTFIGDLTSGNSGSFTFTGQSSPVRDSNKSTATPPLYQTARIFREQSSYEFVISSAGTYLVRLHFFSFSSSASLSTALFDVLASGVSLVDNFSVPNNRSDSPLIKEFIISISIGKFPIYFMPRGSSFAFVNAIELFLAPENFIPSSAQLVSPAGSMGSYEDILSKALLTIHRINVGGPTISPENDTLWRYWVPDDSYLHSPDTAKNASTLSSRPYYDGFSEYIAPDLVYQTAKEMNINNSRISNNFNITWFFNVSKNAVHFVRVHFCDIVSPSLGAYLRFNLYIYSNFSLEIIPYEKNNQVAAPFYVDFVVDSDDSGIMSISIGPRQDSGNPTAFLNGLEIMEIMRELSKGARASDPKSTGVFVIVGSVLGGFVIICILGVVLCLGRRRRKPKATESLDWSPVPVHRGGSTDSKMQAPEGAIFSPLTPILYLGLKISFSEIQFATNNFDMKKKIGKGGFGTVFRGTLSNGTEVAVKRSEPGSHQGLPEFQTEIIVLSKIRHRHLVSLIGYCDENSEMILVYEFMELGTLRDHLYDSSLPSLSWKRRLEICIGAAKGLQYLHRGSSVNLADWAMFCMKKGMMEQIVDASIRSEINVNCQRKFVDTAVRCLEEYGVDRPNMGDVVWDLEYALQLQQTPKPREPHEDSTTDTSALLALPDIQLLPSLSMSREMEDMPILREDLQESLATEESSVEKYSKWKKQWMMNELQPAGSLCPEDKP